MIATIVFSRNRPMQLDLLLRSLEQNGAGFFDPVHVLFKATTRDFLYGYTTCSTEHAAVHLIPDDDLPVQVRYLLHAAEHATFFTDDDVLYRPLPELAPLPFDHWLCFSLRLGENTTWCYPHARRQRMPKLTQGGDLLAWRWRGADGDFGYPWSLDGHVFRGETLRRSLKYLREVQVPNEIEEHLIAADDGSERLLGSYRESHLVGVPANRVNTLRPNRSGEKHPYPPSELNSRYLEGQRIDLAALDFSDVRGAHQELELRFA